MVDTEIVDEQQMAAAPMTDASVLGVFKIVCSAIAVGYSEFFRPTNADLQYSVFDIAASRQRPRTTDDGILTARFDREGRLRSRDMPFAGAHRS